MINNMSALDLNGIARAGGSIEVDGAVYSSLDLSGIARALQPGAHLKIHNSTSKSALDLSGIARAKSGQVIFA